MKVAIVGTGRMACGLAATLRRRHAITLASRDPRHAEAVASELGVEPAVSAAAAAADADVVIPAIPFHALFSSVSTLGDLSGKIVVDITYANADDTYLTILGFDGRSGAEALQARIPEATVVKAWNHVWAEAVGDPGRFDPPATVFVAGEEAGATTVGELVRDSGFAPVFAGPLLAARYLEPYAAFLVYLGYRRGLGERFALDLRLESDPREPSLAPIPPDLA